MADSDDLLSTDEIEALIQASRTEPVSGSASVESQPVGNSELLAQSDFDSLMHRNLPPVTGTSRAGSASPVESVLQQTERNLAAALAPSRPKELPPELGSPSQFSFPDLSSGGTRAADALPFSSLQDVELDLRIELGRTELLIDEVLKLREGSVVPLDKLAGDPVDILVNGQLVARGEVLVLNDNFCVRVAEILTPGD